MLGLQAKSAAICQNGSILSSSGAIQKIAAIKLYARLRRPYLQHSSRYGFHDAGGQFWPAPGGQNPVVVVAFSEFQLLIAIGDALSDSNRRSEIERRSLDFAQLSRGNQAVINR